MIILRPTPTPGAGADDVHRPVPHRRRDRPRPDAAGDPRADAGLQTGPALSIAPGLGLQAWIENGCLQLAQGDDVVALSQTEAKVLFAQFDEWARA